MGFQMGSVCYPDAGSAFDAWQARFPTLPDVNGDVWLFQGGSVTSDGLVSSTIFNTSDLNPLVTTQSFFISSCSEQVGLHVFDKYPVQDVIFAAAFIFAAFVGFAMGRKR